MLDSFVDDDIGILIVDGSVEVAALARVSSVPYLYVKRLGKRHDLTHHAAYEGAVFLLAFYPEEYKPSSTPLWLRQKTLYFGFQSEYADPEKANRAGEDAKVIQEHYRDRPLLTFLSDDGGAAPDAETVALCLAQFPDHEALVLGRKKNEIPIGRAHCVGYVYGDIGGYLAAASCVVGPANLNNAARCISFKKFFIPTTRENDFGESACLKQTLLRAGLALDLNRFPDESIHPIGQRPFPDGPGVHADGAKRFTNWANGSAMDLSHMRSEVREIGNIAKITLKHSEI